MLKVDLFAFGGGYASVPLMLHEVMGARHWMDSKTFMDGIALGQVTPGPIVICHHRHLRGLSHCGAARCFRGNREHIRPFTGHPYGGGSVLRPLAGQSPLFNGAFAGHWSLSSGFS